MKIILSEFDECILLKQYLDFLKSKKKVISYSHIPNGTYTASWKQKTNNKALGVSSGFPDYLILGKDKILVIEMKREKGGVISLEQKFWLENFNRYQNIEAVVCKGFTEAKNVLDLFF